MLAVLTTTRPLSEKSENQVILQKICEWNFDQVIEKVIERHPDLVNRATSLLKQYQLYIYLRAVQDFRLPMACTDIDIIWETHIIFTEDYDNFCIHVKGEKIHHTPSHKHYCDGACADLLTMEQLYNEHFGDNGFWGGSVNICW